MEHLHEEESNPISYCDPEKETGPLLNIGHSSVKVGLNISALRCGCEETQ